MSGQRLLSRLQVVSALQLQQLNRIGIYSVGDLLNANPLQITSYTDISYSDFKALLLEVSSRVVSEPISALALLKKRLQRSHFLSTGLPLLDEALRGGLPVGVLCDLCGLPGAGKSQFCMFVTITTLLQHPGSIIYIDAELKFDVSRFYQVLCAQYNNLHLDCPMDSSQSVALDSFLQRIVIKRPSSLDDFHQTLHTLEEEVISGDTALIVVDSLAALVKRHHLSTIELDRFLLGTASTLTKVASLCHCVVLATNQVVPVTSVSDVLGGDLLLCEDSTVTGACSLAAAMPALGATWQHCVSTRFHLTKVFGSKAKESMDSEHVITESDSQDIESVGKISIVKSHMVPSATLMYAISQAGIRIISDSTYPTATFV